MLYCLVLKLHWGNIEMKKMFTFVYYEIQVFLQHIRKIWMKNNDANGCDFFLIYVSRCRFLECFLSINFKIELSFFFVRSILVFRVDYLTHINATGFELN